jgi:hypothetical protein
MGFFDGIGKFSTIGLTKGLFGDQKTEVTQTIPGQSGQTQQLLALLSQLSSGQAGQLGDLSKLAQGQFGGPTGSDIELIAQSIGRAGELAQNQLLTQFPVIAAQQREGLAARGGSEGSGQTVQAILQGLGQQQAISQSVLQAQQQGGQALFQLPQQRAQLQIGANQALFSNIINAANPVLNTDLQQRLAQTTTTQFTPPNFAQIGKTAAAIGAAPFTGGASLAALGIPTEGTN